MFRKSLVVAATVAVMTLSTPVFAAEWMAVPEETSVTQRISLDSMQKVVTAAAITRNWEIIENAPGKLHLRYAKRPKWWVDVAVTYTEKTYKISYVDSFGLNYKVKDKGAVIHRNYNRWIANLDKSIQLELNRIH